MFTISAYIFAIAVCVVVLFQITLACGAPWGHLSMGGRYPGKFPSKLRATALIQALVLIFLAAVVMIKAKIVLHDYYDVSKMAIWVVVGINVLSLLMNLATPSKWERIIWAPVALVMVVSSLIVAVQ